MSIFPMIQPQIYAESTEQKLYKEIKWDFENNEPVFHNGNPIIISGKEAVFVWAWKALQTARFRYEIYTWDYGCEVESLVGQPFTEELKLSEAARYVKECLLINPYITSVSNITASFKDETLSVSCVIETVYGEVSINV
ncbi:DUF2634 domain-containing protein [Lachnoclostridium phytofermentans]|uniref:DUF2634 domain-containing protein n=1 Tax=Lachnoclostridium phytofermentans TaxID=66219 RepID=UPI00049704AC|nr:DUF2634 domain-containing protein [Lachnoclostridium phytofermentans]